MWGCTPYIFFTPLILTRKRTPKRRPFSCNQPTNGKELGGMTPLVQVGGLEPPRYEPQEPKSCVSANSTIPACWLVSPGLHWCRETSYRNNTSPTEPLPKGKGISLKDVRPGSVIYLFRRAYIWPICTGDFSGIWTLIFWTDVSSWSTFELRSHMAGILGFEPRL